MELLDPADHGQQTQRAVECTELSQEWAATAPRVGTQQNPDCGKHCSQMAGFPQAVKWKEKKAMKEELVHYKR